MVLPDAEAHVISCYGLECEEAFGRHRLVPAPKALERKDIWKMKQFL